MKILALIPARGGSKGIPKKNLVLINNRELIGHSIIEAKKSKYIQSVIVSTDSDEIASVAKKFGADVPFLRPAELSTDSASSLGVIRHALENSLPDFTHLILLQPTSPLRTVQHIDEAIEKFIKIKNANFLFSVKEVDPKMNWVVQENDSCEVKFLVEGAIIKNRQQLKPLYLPNGAIYFASRDYYLNNDLYSGKLAIYTMNEKDSLDIDTEEDLKCARLILEGK